ncbi:ABC transporter ATP-binding protein [[Clostridium] polysaccharolyticum]|uniref:ATP-binding cassette, subfamily B n=1 Tax=[Clostridium] polysaccharolyticum TaxID=29364 RepID=A0A1I0C4I9_9FIRM|nr:ABC transporter ATP-binding protein [[Clostridium] polysaccharolyticum]SET14372.1 ATP-binding cassette, subfamily B [[Clostridium] polysaccharolyticum]
MISKSIREIQWILRKAKIKRELFISSVLLCLSMTFSVLEVWVLKYVIDMLAESDCNHGMGFALGIILMIAMNGFFLFLLQHYILIHIKNPVKRCIVYSTLACVYNLPLQKLSKKKRQYYVELLTHYAEEISNDICNKLVGLRYLLQTVVVACVLLFINWAIFSAVIVLTLLYVVTGRWFMRQFWKKFSVYMDKTNQLHAVIEEGLAATQDILLNNRRKWEIDRYHEYFRRYYKEAKRINFYGNLNFSITSILKWIVVALVLFFGGSLVADGKLSVSSYIIGYQFCYMLLGNMEQAYSVISDLTNLGAKIDRLYEICKEDEKQLGFQPLNKIETMELKAVSYCFFEKQENVLDHVDLEIQAGQKIGVIGKSGSGKSTLVRILLSLLSPTQGTVCVNQVNMNDVDQNAFISKIGYCRQNPYIFPDTIRNNITLGREITDALLDEICKVTEIYDFIMEQENGYDSILGDNGINISSGQKQRISIARTLLGEPDVMILDEATSNLDIQNEKKIMMYLDEMCKAGKTLIVIAHRLWTVENADIIYTIDNKHVVESGSHTELVKNKGIYYELLKEQE